MTDYVICCCSTADLSAERYAEKGIQTVPFHITVGGREYDDLINVTITQEELFSRMVAGEKAFSSQVSTTEYENLWKPILESGKDVFHITLSSGISGTINSAMVAKDNLSDKYPDRKIVVLDSLNGSAGYGMLVDSAADKKAEGLSIDELEKWVLDNRESFNTWVLSTDLTFLIMGGRVKPLAGAIGKALGICPFVTLAKDGSLVVPMKARNKKKAIRQLVDVMAERADNGTDYDGKCFIAHCADPELANAVKDQVEEVFPQLSGKVETFLVGATIGVHLGPHTVVLFFKGALRDAETN
ncbi:MAG: DegV family protein [Lachnospiraceae bacterium]|nr:DegV family protein [Lachnospiraceae bacterium]